MAVSKDGLQYRFVIPGTRLVLRYFKLGSRWSAKPMRQENARPLLAASRAIAPAQCQMSKGGRQ